MKFAIVAVVVLALAMGVQSSVLRLGPAFGLGSRLNIAGHGLQYTAVSGPALIPHGISVAPFEVPSVSVHSAGIPAFIGYAPHAVAAEGTYVAQTPGAIHVAPLPGHLESVSSLNVGAAPGTF